MGVHYEGSLSAGLSRKLTGEELDAWRQAVLTNADPERCCNPAHEGELLTDGHCPRWEPGPGGNYCFGDSERYEPQNWDFTGGTWGDVGLAGLHATGFDVSASGKVYDIEDAIRHFLAALPPDVTAEGDGIFTADGEPFALGVRGREVREGSVIVSIRWDDEVSEAGATV